MNNEPVPVGGVWLLTRGDRLLVLVEVDGAWRVAIDEHRPANADGTPYLVSHCANACGFRGKPADPVLTG